MSLHRTAAIVLRNYQLGETDRITVFLSADYGKLSGVTPRSRKLTSPFAGRLEPLSEVDLVYFLREGKSLARVNTVDLIHSFQSVRDDLSRLGSALKMSELTDRFSREGEPAPLLYGLFSRSLQALERGTDGISLLVFFAFHLMTLSGYEPQLRQCVHCGRPPAGEALCFSPILGGVLCADCSPLIPDRMGVSTGVLTVLNGILPGGPEALAAAPGTAVVLRHCLALLERHIQARTGRATSLRPFFE